MIERELVVIGGGPAGLAAALAAWEQGVRDILILERDSQANEIGLHYDGFVRATNRMLEECNMDRLYAANPYESFIMLCMRTESPIETYAEIWGMSYDEY